MRAGVVPLGIAAADGEDAAVAHVDRDEDALALVSGDRTLSEDHFFRVDVVVHRMERFARRDADVLKQFLGDFLAVQSCEALADLDVVQIVIEIFAEEEGEVGRHGHLLRAKVPMQFLDGLLQLSAPPFRLVAADHLVSCRKERRLAVREVDGEGLIDFGDLRAEAAAARVNDEVVRAVGAAVDLDEVVAAAERAEALGDALDVLEITIAAKLREVELRLPPLPQLSARRDDVRRLIDLGKIKLRFAEIDGIHAAADVDADEVRHDLVRDRHRRADRAALSPVDVGHDADARAFRDFIVAHAPDLLDGFVFDDLRIGDRRRGLSLDFQSFHRIASSAS